MECALEALRRFSNNATVVWLVSVSSQSGDGEGHEEEEKKTANSNLVGCLHAEPVAVGSVGYLGSKWESRKYKKYDEVWRNAEVTFSPCNTYFRCNDSTRCKTVQKWKLGTKLREIPTTRSFVRPNRSDLWKNGGKASTEILKREHGGRDDVILCAIE